ncbi:MAG TPA: hypothetical protein VGN72_00265 [Tepidisphaeraceae bacterium]|nr:hypothetical protein [Tepidisphaeraceae bacterium]
MTAELVPLIERLLVEGALDDYEVERDGLSIDGLHCWLLKPRGNDGDDDENANDR